MASPSIPDRAATLVNALQQAQSAVDRVKAADGDWTAHHLLLNDVVTGVEQALGNAWLMACRVRDLADNEAARLKGKK